jgi:hypothetical protein
VSMVRRLALARDELRNVVVDASARLTLPRATAVRRRLRLCAGLIERPPAR